MKTAGQSYRSLRTGLAMIALTPALAAALLALLAATHMIPDRLIAKNIAVDPSLLVTPRPYSFSGRKIDVGTECIGVSYGLGAGDLSPLEAAALSPVLFDCASLRAFVDGAGGDSGPYIHYWHGYAAISRPLLALFPYHDLKMLTFNAMAILFAFLAVGLARRAGARFAFAALLPFFFVNYSGFFELWTKAAPWMVMLIVANIIVRTRWTGERRPFLLFYFAGAATAYLDLLSTPLLIFGYPAALYFLLALQDGDDGGRGQIGRLALIGGFWTIGYAGVWLMKPAIAAAFLGPEVFASFAGKAAFRISGAYESVKHFFGAATLENLEAFKGFWGALAIIAFFIAPFLRRDGWPRLAALVRRAPAAALIALSPFVWYEILSNHSQIHGLFTHANLVLTFLPSSLLLVGADKAPFLAGPPQSRPAAAG